MRTKESKRLLSEFLLDLRTLSQEKGYQFNSEPSLSFAKQLQLYEFHANNRTYNLFIRVSVEQGFWGCRHSTRKYSISFHGGRKTRIGL
jgi:hypothetical protein